MIVGRQRLAKRDTKEELLFMRYWSDARSEARRRSYAAPSLHSSLALAALLSVVAVRSSYASHLHLGLSPTRYPQFVTKKVSYKGCSFNISKLVSTCWFLFFPTPTSVCDLLV